VKELDHRDVELLRDGLRLLRAKVADTARVSSPLLASAIADLLGRVQSLEQALQEGGSPLLLPPKRKTENTAG
jgi:hypothetical protein